MLEFLSDDWITAMHKAAAGDAGLSAMTADISLTIEQHVTGGPLGDVCYHLAFEHGSVIVASGEAIQPTIRFHQDHATAAAISQGQVSAQRAFMTGRLRVGGDLRALVDHADVFAQLSDVFAEVRAATTSPVG